MADELTASQVLAWLDTADAPTAGAVNTRAAERLVALGLGPLSHRAQVESRKQIRRALRAIGERWRFQWADFDGRTLRSQLDEVCSMFDAQPEQAKATADEFVEARNELAEELQLGVPPLP